MSQNATPAATLTAEPSCTLEGSGSRELPQSNPVASQCAVMELLCKGYRAIKSEDVQQMARDVRAEIERLERELAEANMTAAARNVVIGEMGQEIERLREELAQGRVDVR